jgi:hypothetical protein
MAGLQALLDKMLFEIIEGFICVANAKLNNSWTPMLLILFEEP